MTTSFDDRSMTVNSDETRDRGNEDGRLADCDRASISVIADASNMTHRVDVPAYDHQNDSLLQEVAEKKYASNLSREVEIAGLQAKLDALKPKFRDAIEIIVNEHSRVAFKYAALQAQNRSLLSLQMNMNKVSSMQSAWEGPYSPISRTSADPSFGNSDPDVYVDCENLALQAEASIPRGPSDFPESRPSINQAFNNNRLYEHISKKVEEQLERDNRPKGSLAQDLALAQGWMKNRKPQNLADVPHDRTSLTRFVSGMAFDTTCAIIIVANSVFLAFSTDYAAEQGLADATKLPVVFIVTDYLFGAWFVFELLIRITAFGPIRFYRCIHREWLWNYFDTIIVALYILEVITTNLEAGAGANLTALRMLKVLRIARALKVVRLVRIFKELRMMVLSVLNSFMTLLWAMLLLCILMAVFAIFLTQNVNGYLYGGDTPHHGTARELKHQFGSLARSFYTLFVAVSGGRSWQEISDPLFHINWTTGLLFCFYIFFTMFAMLNIITGIFLETAMNSTKSDHDECIAEQLHAEDSTIKAMQKIFDEADEDHNGTITIGEFDRHLSDPRMRAYLASIGIESGEAEGLFRLLDIDNSGEITVEEFLFGCMRVKGNAKAVDVATLLYENKRMFEKWNYLSAYIEKQFSKRAHWETKIESALLPVIKAANLQVSMYTDELTTFTSI